MKKIRFLIISLMFCVINEYDLQAQACLSLDSCMEWARQNNVEMKNATLDIHSAMEIKKQAETKFFPSVTGVALGYHALNPLLEYGIDDVESAAARDMLHNLYAEYGAALGLPNSISLCERGFSVGVTAVQPLFAGGRIVNGNKLAQMGVKAAETQLQLTRQQVDLKTEQYYWTIVSLQEKMKTLQQVMGLLDTLYRDVVTARAAGLVIDNDVLKVSLKQSEMKSNMLKVSNALRLSKGAMCQHIGKGFDENMSLDDSLSFSLVTPETVYKPEREAVHGRFESQLLEMSVSAEELKRKMVLGESLPQCYVGVAGSYGSLVKEQYNYNGLAFATIQLPLSAWWESAHKLKEHRIAEQKAMNTRQDMIEKMSLETRQVWNTLEESYQQVVLCEQQLTNAYANMSVEQDHYHAGLIPIADLLEAQTLYRQAADQLVDSKINYRLTLTRYLQIVKE